jgi:hypothetical protein
VNENDAELEFDGFASDDVIVGAGGALAPSATVAAPAVTPPTTRTPSRTRRLALVLHAVLLNFLAIRFALSSLSLSVGLCGT